MKKHYYIDVDGVLADFDNEPKALLRYATEKDFFKKLKPFQNNINAVKKLAKNNKVFILTISPNEQATQSKIEWIKKYLPEIPKKHIKILKTGQRKIDSVKNKKKAILFDDYGKNVKEWLEKGGLTAFKITQKHDNRLKAINQASSISSALVRLELFK